MAEHYPTKSVAVLAEQGKVTGWEQPESNASQLNSGVGDEMNALDDAQVVSTNKPEFVPKAEDPVSLKKGPKKKYIDNKQNNDNDSSSEDGIKVGGRQLSYHGDNVMNDSTSTQQTTAQTPQSHVQFESQAATTTTTTESNANTNTNNSNMNEFDGGMDDLFGNNDNSNDNDSKKRVGGNNATMISLPNVDNDYHDAFDDMDDDDDVAYDVDITNSNGNDNNGSKIQEQQESTVLTLWEQERRGVLEERMEKEKKKQRENEEEARNDLKEFLEKREERMRKARDAAKAREDDIRNDYSSVYKNGTIWQQVAKLVDLTTQDETVERMRDLIIDLKNQAKK